MAPLLLARGYWYLVGETTKLRGRRALPAVGDVDPSEAGARIFSCTPDPALFGDPETIAAVYLLFEAIELSRNSVLCICIRCYYRRSESISCVGRVLPANACSRPTTCTAPGPPDLPAQDHLTARRRSAAMLRLEAPVRRWSAASSTCCCRCCHVRRAS